MLRKTAKSMAAFVMAFLFLCGCTHNRDESVNTQQNIVEEYFGSESVSDGESQDGANTSQSGSTSGNPECMCFRKARGFLRRFGWPAG